MENKAPSRGSSLINRDMQRLATCKLKSCGESFHPTRKDQVFHLPECKALYLQEVYRTGLKVVNSTGMHAAKLENSERLQNIYALLSDGQWHTGLQIAQVGPTTAPSSAIQELKHPINGFIIESRCEKRTESNRPLWEYRIWTKVSPGNGERGEVDDSGYL